MSKLYSLEDLKYLMARLRDPDSGCPWDRAQDFSSIVPHTLEEAYEVADAIERQDFAHLREELGDLLFQVVFYGQLGQEQDRFDLDAIISDLVAKLVRRHPHVFPDGTLQSRRNEAGPPDEAAIKASWERIKEQERRASLDETADTSALADVPVALPALVRARKLQRRAAGVGFDWDSLGQVFAKLDEEKAELEEAWESGDPDAVEDELGDLLFVCVNLSRFLKANPDSALRRANRKFERRFREMERLLSERGESFDQHSMDQLEALWQDAKRRLAEESTPSGSQPKTDHLSEQ